MRGDDMVAALFAAIKTGMACGNDRTVSTDMVGRTRRHSNRRLRTRFRRIPLGDWCGVISRSGHGAVPKINEAAYSNFGLVDQGKG
jgi:hypothetical protein